MGQIIERGPYLQSVTTESIFVKWRTDIVTDSKVWYGDNPTNLSYTIELEESIINHEILIDGLMPNTTYYYAVGTSDEQLVGADSSHYFITTPESSATQTIRAWVLGDAGTYNNNQRAVRDAYYNYIGGEHTDMILLLGDNAYSDGTDSEYQLAWFEDMYEDKLINSIMWSTFGNHDGNSANSETETGPYYDIFTFPRNAEAGGIASGTEAYYSFDYGNIHIVSLNSDDVDRSTEGEMMQWLESDLNATNQTWKIVMFHHAPYTGEKNNESDYKLRASEMRENAAPIMEAGGVDLVLSGHTHAYQRSFLINGHYGVSSTWDPDSMGVDLGDGRLDGDGPYLKDIGTPAGNEATVYIVAGSSGKLELDDYNHPVMGQNVEKLGSVVIEVNEMQMDVKFIDEDSIVSDYFTIIKQGNPPEVNITNPLNNDYFDIPQTITIEADATDNGSITQVEFFIDNVSIGVDATSPYSMEWEIPADGNYNIKAVATDDEDNYSFSNITIQVGPSSVCSKVNNSSNDAEEKANGNVNITSSDLELVYDGSDQIVGMRFKNLNIPQCAVINNAFIQFTVDEISNINPCTIQIYGETSDNASAFQSTNNNLTNRIKTTATVDWTPPDWLTIGDNGPDQKTVDVAPIIQEIVNREGFTSNSSIVILLEGTGRRVAVSYNGNSVFAPEICVEFVPYGPDDDGDGTCNANDLCPGIPEPGTPCDDEDSGTYNDVIDSNCDCTGIPYDCPVFPANIGDACNDADPGTYNDVIDSNCDCTGIPYDCPVFPANIGDLCDDGDSGTYNDIIDSTCNCIGIPFDCPEIQADIGDLCDDGDPNTANDMIDSNCECVGIFYECPNVPGNIGESCDDGDPNSINDVIDSLCVCLGITTTSSIISNDDDDAEEKTNGNVNITSSDLEMVIDNNDDQVIGLRFNNLDIPQGAHIESAYIQFTVDQTNNINPSNLEIFGEAVDDALTFTTNLNDITSRPKTDSSIIWSPQDWLAVDDSGPAQQTDDISTIIQEIVDRVGFTTNSSIAIVIEGEGKRTAVSYDGNANDAPVLVVTYKCKDNNNDGICDLCPDGSEPNAPCDDGDPGTYNDTTDSNCDCIGIPYDCPSIPGNIGDPCDDGDPNTSNDTVDPNCICIGTYDCPSIPANFGDSCDDGDPNTLDDMIDSNCDCVGTFYDCPSIPGNIGDTCDDGNPETSNDEITSNCECMGVYDCPSIPGNIGDPCDDGDPNTLDDMIDTNCNCVGIFYDCPSIPANIGDLCDDGDPFTLNDEITSNCDCVGIPYDCPSIPGNIGDPCDDGNPETSNDEITSNCECLGTYDCPSIPGNIGDPCDDGNPETSNDEITSNCECLGTYDCPSIPGNIGDPCDDGDTGTYNDSVNSNCECVGIPYDCPSIPGNIGDTCDDGNPNSSNDVIDSNCVCLGSITTTSTVNSNSDDAEEKTNGTVSTLSSDLEMIIDGSNDQTIGIRFENLNIPQGAEIDYAFIQFTADQTDNVNPSDLELFGEASDDAFTFSTSNFDITNRPKTIESLIWTPDDWQNVGDAGPEQQTVNIASIIQEIVDRIGFTTNSSIVIIIEGSGKRTAVSYDGNANEAPELIVTYRCSDSDDDGICDLCPGGPQPSEPCDDGDASTYNDTIDSNCDCIGIPYDCPTFPANIGDLCDDGNPETSNDIITSNCECIGSYDCPSIPGNIGDTCDDGNPETSNDEITSNCECLGTYDCPSIPGNIGDPCDDGNPETSNDEITSNCECLGTYDCPSIPANFGDPCDDGNPETSNDEITSNCECLGTYDCPSIPGNIGDPCNDGNPETSNDEITSNCECVGIPYDCPSIPGNIGDTCDDGNPNSNNDVIDSNCVCLGSITTTSTVNSNSDDAEEKTNGTVSTLSSDLEMIIDGSNDQTIGIRFENLNIPQGAEIDYAFIQFTADQTDNVNPSDLELFGEASDDAFTFSTSNFDITNRPKTVESLIWTPDDWQNVGDAGPEQQTVNISSIIQEIVDRIGFTTNSSIVIIIEGSGKRTAVSYDGNASEAPELIVTYRCSDSDDDGICDLCPGGPQPGDPCDDGDASTYNDTTDSNCDCIGIPYDCPTFPANIGDPCNDGNPETSNDIITSNCECIGSYDCPSIPANIGDPCDDGNAETSNDIITSNCECIGSYDCPDISANIGDPCDDGDTGTYNDLVDANCNCVGTPYDCPSFPANIGDSCDDGNPETSNDLITSNCECIGSYDCPSFPANIGDSCDDGNPETSNDIITSNCECVGTYDCPSIPANIGDPCDDGDSETYDDSIDSNCNCVGSPYECPSIPGNIGDSCDDGDPNTLNDIIDANCICWGSITTISSVNQSSDDAEEIPSGIVGVFSSDLEMIMDGSNDQTIGIRFENLDIPHGATIESAFIQFTADQVDNVNPVALDIFGEASDHALTFTNTNNDISSRPKTIATITWTPADWQNVGDSGPAQKTDDISSIIQEIVDRSGFLSSSSIAIIIEGVGKRTAVAYDGDPNEAPELIVTYKCIDSNNDGFCDICPGGNEPGDLCDDGDSGTFNDTIDSNCDCVGTPYDCPTIPANIGDPCDDDDSGTYNDMISSNCLCEGTPYDCPSIPADIGDPCDDGDANTTNDLIDQNCICIGTPLTNNLACSIINNSTDDAEEKADGSVSLYSSDLEMIIDGGATQTIGLRFVNLNIPQGAIINTADIQFTVDQTDNLNPCILEIYGEASDDAATFGGDYNITNRPKTLSMETWSPEDWLNVGDTGPAQKTINIASVIQEIVDRVGYTSNSAMVIIVEGAGKRTAKSFNSNPSEAPEICIEYYDPPQSILIDGNTSIIESGDQTETLEENENGENPFYIPVNIYPNPATDQLMISFTGYQEEKVNIQIMDLNGRMLLTEKRNVVVGDNDLKLENLNLKNGIYFIQLNFNETVYSSKFTILK